MAHGLALDQAAWSSPWRARSVRDKGVLSLGLLLVAVSLPPVPGAAGVGLVSLVLLLGPIRVSPARLGRIIWMPLLSIGSLIYRFVFGLLEGAGAIHQAQQARLGYATRRAAMRSAAMGMAVLFIRSWDRARRLESGLAGRGYVDSLRTLEPVKTRSLRFLLGSIGLLGVLVAGSLFWTVTQ